jgi:hypothetical protein
MNRIRTPNTWCIPVRYLRWVLPELITDLQCCRSPFVSMRIRIHLFISVRTDPGSQMRFQILVRHEKLNFYMKNRLKVGTVTGQKNIPSKIQMPLFKGTKEVSTAYS